MKVKIVMKKIVMEMRIREHKMLKHLAYPLFLLSLIIWSSAAYADIEASQGVLGTIRTGIENAKTVQEDLNQIQSDLRTAAGGAVGPIKDAVQTANSLKNEAEANINAAKEKVDTAKNLANNPESIAADPEGALASIGSKMPGFTTEIDTNNMEELTTAIQKNYFMQKPKSNSSEKSNSSSNAQSSQSSTTSSDTSSSTEETTDLVAIKKAQEEKMSEIQRENFANLYASAFTIRTNLAKEASEEKDKENTRDIIQSTNDKATEMVKRLSKIMLMQAMLFEFNMTQQARQFSYAEEEEE